MPQLTVVIPSFNRGAVLLDTLGYLESQIHSPSEIIIVDQTEYVESNPLYKRLIELDKAEKIRFIHQAEPSIPKAMNRGLIEARSELVLFLDDDIVISKTFVLNHIQALKQHNLGAQVGQVLQPGESCEAHSDSYNAGEGLLRDMHFLFRGNSPATLHNCMAGNLLVDRAQAIECGGFDENFVGAAYRFETEFCRRMIRHTMKPFYFTPLPVLNHLQCKVGGTRAHANHLKSAKPHHSMGDYYFALLEGRGCDRLNYIGGRFFKSVIAKFYLIRPWYLPVRIIAETRGFLLALKLYRSGQRLIVEKGSL